MVFIYLRRAGAALVVVLAFVIVVASLAVERRLQASVVVVHGLSCPAAHGIFPNQELDPCPLHWKADS